MLINILIFAYIFYFYLLNGFNPLPKLRETMPEKTRVVYKFKSISIYFFLLYDAYKLVHTYNAKSNR